MVADLVGFNHDAMVENSVGRNHGEPSPTAQRELAVEMRSLAGEGGEDWVLFLQVCCLRVQRSEHWLDQ
jgi:hypothetical protein